MALAETEDRVGDPNRVLATVDEALATCDRIGHRNFEAKVHRLRSDVFLQRADPTPAEEAYLTPLSSRSGKARGASSLLAALSLAKLYQSSDRPIDAHAVLAPALEGFSATPEMPEIAEAQALLAALDNEGVNLGVGLSAGS